MPRARRIDFEGAWQHVMNRGAGRMDIFWDARDRGRFLDELADAAERAALEIHAFCLMGNHYHILVRSLRGQLSMGMQQLSSNYTHYANARMSRDGPLFRGRFHCVTIESDAHLIQALRYIHFNPVDAGAAQRPEEWTWSSATAYLDPTTGPPWLKTSFLLSMFGTALGASYRAFLAAGVDEQTRGFYQSLP